LWDETGKKNLFSDPSGELGLSKLAYQFLGGIMNCADEMCAIFNPTVNSYKRINAPRTTSGATWAPNTITYTGNNRTHMVRIPDAGRFELRLMDGAANPYLLQAGILAAGLDGIANQRDPGERLDINMYTDGHTVKNGKKLPLNLLDAIRLMNQSKTIRAEFGDTFVDAYCRMKTEEWNSFTKHLTEWERQNTLDC
jgi:glutamine synthetase